MTAPSSLNFNNVVSLGVSYSWDHEFDPKKKPENPGKITKNKRINLGVLNLDLSNMGGSAISALQQTQKQYLNSKLINISANGLNVGQGKLTSLSVQEGSQSNSVITNLGYEIKVDAEEEEEQEETNDPVSRSHSINVTRNIENNTYQITNSYSVNYGNDFDLVTDHPLYSGDANYENVDGRLKIAKQEALTAVNNLNTDFSINGIIDFSAYTTQNGWNDKLLEKNCSGAVSSLTYTQDYINGNFEATKTTNLKYTGIDYDTGATGRWDIEYTISFDEKNDPYNNELSCYFLKMDGTILGSIPEACTGFSGGGSEQAQSGYEYFVEGGRAEKRMQDFFSKIKGSIPKIGKESLNDMVDLVKTACVPSVVTPEQEEAELNDGTINFSFEMNNCKEIEKRDDSDIPFLKQESESESQSHTEDCLTKFEIPLYEAQKTISIEGICGPNISGDQYVRYDSIEEEVGSEFTDIEATKPENANSEFWEIKSKEISTSKYQAKATCTVLYNDLKYGEDCMQKKTDCELISKDSQNGDGKRIVSVNTPYGKVEEDKGPGLIDTQSTVSIESIIDTDQCDPKEMKEFINVGLNEIKDDLPECFINGISWSYNTEFKKPQKMSLNVRGFDPPRKS